ncbi:Magnesium chelatase ATPase subunit I [Edwardsiella anguillarum]|uniref:hypothetical protein n=2 Tax=Hafniaceae TaxID=1903412 RepID=UPI00045C4067|nr:Magnesium chelatase ATPase subunit I [Edwardsiella anguillarum]BET83310.1 Magnesium chelatase ATPase subunit I [Edwardsiella anguillarum]BET86677.1 Magnesium chelatase ATPase subunit I [Edwardsiella anguillarum]BET90103.1 Magnesium chelatase ATPase subunit I [Edwardsiella anguillarum]GAJ66680.1 magnesium chelatase ATPase subunit I [Edwardsiella piscicida]
MNCKVKCVSQGEVLIYFIGVCQYELFGAELLMDKLVEKINGAGLKCCQSIVLLPSAMKLKYLGETINLIKDNGILHQVDILLFVASSGWGIKVLNKMLSFHSTYEPFSLDSYKIKMSKNLKLVERKSIKAAHNSFESHLLSSILNGGDSRALPKTRPESKAFSQRKVSLIKQYGFRHFNHFCIFLQGSESLIRDLFLSY